LPTTYLVDTNIVSAAMRDEIDLETWLDSLAEGSRLITCTIVRGEILFGIARLPEGRRRIDLERKAQQVFAALPCEPIRKETGDRYAEVKAACQRKGLPLDENDLWVAATALALGATLVSRDSDFAQVDGLAVTAIG
jgi:predicted nucleic acid-binding protein